MDFSTRMWKFVGGGKFPHAGGTPRNKKIRNKKRKKKRKRKEKRKKRKGKKKSKRRK